MNFNELGLIDPILKALKQKGYRTPTEIQRKAIPHILSKKDILGTAQTGTGKTAAFVLPIIQQIDKFDIRRHQPVTLRALILTPTRELALQIGDNIRAYSKFTKVRHTTIFGGVKQHQQVPALNSGVHILVATPGRLLDLIGQGIISLEDLKLFVLDEADRMLDMGFIHDINKLLQLLPKKRQSLFFSATMPRSIQALSGKILNHPVKVNVAPVSSAAETVTQLLYYTNRKDKMKLLVHLIEMKNMEQALIFCRTKHGADRVTRQLNKKNGIHAMAIHGDKAQNQRQKALKKFKDRKLQILVATDIASRGIDIDKMEFVINYDIPNESETYVHRIGRTGRAGESGLALSICEPEENIYIKGIEKLIRKKIDVVSEHPYPQTERPMTEAERKEFNKEKQRRKQEFFANRNKKRNKQAKR